MRTLPSERVLLGGLLRDAPLCRQAGGRVVVRATGSMDTVHPQSRGPHAVGRASHAEPPRRHQIQHPVAGPLELTYQPLDLPMSAREARSLTLYTAEPGTPNEDRIKVLSSWATTPAGRPRNGAKKSHHLNRKIVKCRQATTTEPTDAHDHAEVLDRCS